LYSDANSCTDNDADRCADFYANSGANRSSDRCADSISNLGSYSRADWYTDVRSDSCPDTHSCTDRRAHGRTNSDSCADSCAN